jgi:protein involved in polysaccharide export with SLBB domain
VSSLFFGQDQLSGEFAVEEEGFMNLPSLGAIQAGGQTVTEFLDIPVTRYAIYVTDPKVTVSGLNNQ